MVECAFFSGLAVMPSGHGALPFLSLDIAFLISVVFVRSRGLLGQNLESVFSSSLTFVRVIMAVSRSFVATFFCALQSGKIGAIVGGLFMAFWILQSFCGDRLLT